MHHEVSPSVRLWIAGAAGLLLLVSCAQQSAFKPAVEQRHAEYGVKQRDGAAPPGSGPTRLRPVRPPSPSRSPAAAEDPAERAAQELGKLQPGNIAWNPPQTMRVGDSVDVQVRIGDAATRIPDLTGGMLRPPVEPAAEIRITRTMKVNLTGASDEFQIDRKSPEEQIVENGQPTEWLWTVKPLRSGAHKLFLRAIAVVDVGGTEKVKEFPVYTDQVQVRINWPLLVQTNWKPALGWLSGTGFFAWLIGRARKRFSKGPKGGRKKATHG